MDQRPLRDIEPEMAPGDDRVTDFNLGVAVFLVKKPEEKGGVICSRIRQTVLRDEGQLLFELRAQRLVVEGGVAPDFKIRLLGNLFLLFGDELLLFLLLLLLREFDRALTQDQVTR